MSMINDANAQARARRRALVGGLDGQELQQLGHWPPGGEPVPITDWCILDERNPTTNYHRLYPRAIRSEQDNNVNPYDTQLVGMFETTVNNIRKISIPCTRIDPNGTWNGWGAFAGTFCWTAHVGCALLKAPLAPGATPANPYGLDLLTWNLGYNGTPGYLGAGGTLYGTPANFEAITYPYMGGASGCHLNPAGAGAYGGSMTEAWDLTIDLGTSGNNGDPTKGQNGPYTGIAVFFRPTFRGGAFINPGPGNFWANISTTLRGIQPWNVSDAADQTKALVFQDDLKIGRAD